MPKSTHTVDEYLSPSFYNKHTKTRERGFESFEQEGQYYFCYYEGSKVVLLSQAYTAASGRDNGIASVKKNMKLKKRFRFTDRENGQYGFSLIAGNHQEIAISRDFGSRKSAENIAGLMNGSVKATLKKPSSSKKPTPKKGMAKKPAPKKTTPKKVALNTRARTRSNEDNYKPLAFYQKHIKSKADGISRFEGDDGLHYFTYNENKKIVLISEGYPSKAVRDTGAASVEKNRRIESRYKFRKLRNGKHDFKLFAGNHKEIARSVWYSSAAMAAAGAAYLMGTRKRAVKPKAPKSKAATIAKAAPMATLGAAATATPIMAKPPAKRVTKPIPKPVIAPKAPIAAVAPALALRPAGAVAPAAAAPLNKPAALAPAVAAAPAALATEASIAGGAIGGAGGLRGVLWLIPLLLLLAFLLLGFKSCGNKAVRPVSPIVETIEPAPNPVVEPKGESVAPVQEPVASDTVAPEPVAPEPVITPEPVIAKEPVIEPVIEPVVEPTPPPSPRPVAPKPVAPKLVASNQSLMACSRSDNALFNVPQNITPVSVMRLGTMPEFGDSHGLTPAEFYDKLTRRYLSRQYDQQYLDFLFRSMGYENGFKDATPQMFSNVTLAQGAKGVLGLGEFHGMQVSQLNVKSARDLEAFNIKSLNGQNVNFMKTCGNFMHVCQ